MGGKRITAFYMELLVLIAVFTGVILVLSQVFVEAKEQSAQAKVLTNAVCLAENTAEMASAAGSEEAFLALVQDDGGNFLEEEGLARTRYNSRMAPDPDGPFLVEVRWAGQNGLETAQVQVYWQDGPEPVYQLETAVYQGGAGG